MRNVSGYLTDDGKFFSDKKEAEAHERMANMTKHINAFVEQTCPLPDPVLVRDWVETLTKWEKYRAEVTK